MPYTGPERRADAKNIGDLRDAVLDLSSRVAGMTEALEEATATAGAAQADAAAVRERSRRDRRNAAWFFGFAGLMIIGLIVALVVAFVGLRREHNDFLALRAQSVNSCQVRNAQARNAIAFYRSLGDILVGAEKEGLGKNAEGPGAIYAEVGN